MESRPRLGDKPASRSAHCAFVFAASASLHDLARRLLTGVGETSSGRDEVMMKKRFTLGIALCALMGIAIFGSSSKHAESVAQADPTEARESVAPVSAKAEPVAPSTIHASLGA